MKKNINSIEKWCYVNLDLVEESLEKNKKAVILVSGASASGKSYSSEKLKEFLVEKGYRTLILQTDHYNRGISGILVNKVNQNFFNNKLTHVEEIQDQVKNVIINSSFSEKLNEINLIKIKKLCSPYIEKEKLNTFLNGLTVEFARINFDEPMVYNLETVASDMNTLLNNKTITKKLHTKLTGEQVENSDTYCGKDYDVIIVEGIYALHDTLINNLSDKNYISNFILGDEKTLFLRRVLRDAKITTISNGFTIKNYLDFVYPSYKKLILPSQKHADIICENHMTFEELRNGEIISNQQKVKLNNLKIVKTLKTMASKVEVVYEKDLYIENKDKAKKETDNVLRVRSVSKDFGKTYTLSSLVHKGTVKVRKDNIISRPLNVLIKEGEFNSIYSTEEEFVKKLEENNFVVAKTIIKERHKLLINGEKFNIDFIEGQGVFVEFAPENNLKLKQLIENNGQKCTSFYEELNVDEPISFQK